MRPKCPDGAHPRPRLTRRSRAIAGVASAFLAVLAGLPAAPAKASTVPLSVSTFTVHGTGSQSQGCAFSLPHETAPVGQVVIERQVGLDPASCTYTFARTTEPLATWTPPRGVRTTPVASGSDLTATGACTAPTSYQGPAWGGTDPCWLHEMPAAIGHLVPFYWEFEGTYFASCPEYAVSPASCSGSSQSVLAQAIAGTSVDGVGGPGAQCVYDGGGFAEADDWQGYATGWNANVTSAGGSVGCTTETANTAATFTASDPTSGVCAGTVMSLTANSTATWNPYYMTRTLTGGGGASYSGEPFACAKSTYFFRIITTGEY
jgi:hypothetical protein